MTALGYANSDSDDSLIFSLLVHRRFRHHFGTQILPIRHSSDSLRFESLVATLEAANLFAHGDLAVQRQGN